MKRPSLKKALAEKYTAQHDAHSANGRPASTDASPKRPSDPLPDWRPFPVEALPPSVATFVSEAAGAIKCDPSYVALPCLSAIASAIGATRVVSAKSGWNEPALVWTAVIGESGTTKTPAFSVATRPLVRLQSAAFKAHKLALDEYDQTLLRYDAELSEWKRGKGAGDPPPKPRPPICSRYVVSDATCEALAPIIEENPRGVLYSRDELAGWLSFNEYKKGSGSDTTNWLSTWTAGPWTIDRKTGRRTTHIDRAVISVAGTIQPAILSHALGKLRLEDGLAARLLFAHPPRRAKVWSDAVISAPVEQGYERLLAQLLALRFIEDPFDADDVQPLVLTLTSEARKRFIVWANAHNARGAETTGPLAAAMSKLEAYCLRLALLNQLCCDVQSQHVDAPSIDAGTALADWFANEARRAYAMLAETEDDRDHRELVELITRRGGRIAPRELAQSSRKYQPVDVAEAALDALVEAKLGTWEMIPSRTNKARVFALSAPSTSTDSSETSVLREFVDVDTPDAADKGGA